MPPTQPRHAGGKAADPECASATTARAAGKVPESAAHPVPRNIA